MKCPNCGFEEHIDDAEYCQECGVFLINFCSSDMCENNNGDNAPLPANAKYCPDCGTETTFKLNGFFDKK